MIRSFPLIFIILWSSAFVTTKPIVDNSDPFAALAFRFFLVFVGFYIFCIITEKKIIFEKNKIFQSITSGVLFHGIYLGGVFFAVSTGIPTGTTALIVTLQPILTNILAGPILNEDVNWKQWTGIILGFVGALLVLGLDIGNELSILGIFSSVLGLAAITSATIWQKKYSENLPLTVSNMYQALGGCLFHLILVAVFFEPNIIFNKTFLLAMSHQIFLVSFGAFTILMYLIKNNSASKTVSIFFLIPSTTAFIAWIFLGEILSFIDVLGFLITSIGVFIATRRN